MDVICVNIGKNCMSSLTNYLPYLKFLSIEKSKRLCRLVHKENFLQSLVADLLVRMSIVKRLNLSNKEIVFSLNDYGKPTLNGGNLEFNISHSGEWVTVIVGQHPVGIDVEQIHPIKMDIARRFFSEQEYADLLMKEKEEQIKYFFDLWTLKESYMKACGKGFAIPLNSISFSLDNGKWLFKDKHSSRQAYFKHYELDKMYKLAVCSFYQDFPEEIEVIELEDLLSEVSYSL